MKFFFSNLLSKFFSHSSMVFNRARKRKTWLSYSEKLCNKCFLRSKISLNQWFHGNVFPSIFLASEDFSFKTWHVLKMLIRILERFGSLFQNLILSRKFWLKLCSFSNKFSWWKLFCFKVWNEKFSIQKLTGDKMVVSYSDTL